MKLMSLGLRNQFTSLPEIFTDAMFRRADRHRLPRHKLEAEHGGALACPACCPEKNRIWKFFRHLKDSGGASVFNDRVFFVSL